MSENIEIPDNIEAHTEDYTTIYVAADDYGYSSPNSDYKTPKNGCDAAFIDEVEDGHVVCTGVYEGKYEWDITNDVGGFDDKADALSFIADELN